MTTVYITKYALIYGVIECEVSERNIDEGVYLSIKLNPSDTFGDSFYMGRDAFYDRDEAERAVENMRAKKIASLEKRLAKIKGKNIVWKVRGQA